MNKGILFLLGLVGWYLYSQRSAVPPTLQPSPVTGVLLPVPQQPAIPIAPTPIGPPPYISGPVFPPTFQDPGIGSGFQGGGSGLTDETCLFSPETCLQSGGGFGGPGDPFKRMFEF